MNCVAGDCLNLFNMPASTYNHTFLGDNILVNTGILTKNFLILCFISPLFKCLKRLWWVFPINLNSHNYYENISLKRNHIHSHSSINEQVTVELYWKNTIQILQSEISSWWPSLIKKQKPSRNNLYMDWWGIFFYLALFCFVFSHSLNRDSLTLGWATKKVCCREVKESYPRIQKLLKPST